MSFDTALVELTGAAADPFDIRAAVRRCFFYDFLGYAVRLWDGHGVLQAGGYEWLGTFDESGRNHHTAPTVKDTRDGSAPSYEFGIPYLDQETFDAIKASRELARGRDMTCYHVLCKVGEGLRPTTDLRFAFRLTIVGLKFGASVKGTREAPVAIRSVTAVCKSLEYGRKRVPAGTMTDTAQRERARVLGLASDSGCSMVASNAHRTFTVPA